jgi:hypothetical protein
MTANTHPQNPQSPATKPDANASQEIVFYDGMSEEELDLLLQASLREDIEKTETAEQAATQRSAAQKSDTQTPAEPAEAEPVLSQIAGEDSGTTSAAQPVIATAVPNASVPRPNTLTKYYSALSPSVADRTVFRSHSHQVQTAQERAAIQAAEVPKPARSHLVIEDTVVEFADELKNLTPAPGDSELSKVAPTAQQPAATPRKSLKALTAAHSTSVKIRPKVAPAAVVNKDEEASQTKAVATPAATTKPAKTDDTAPKKASAIKIKPKAAVEQPKTIAAASDSEVIVAQTPIAASLEPAAVATKEETLSAALETVSPERSTTHVETISDAEASAAEPSAAEISLPEPVAAEPTPAISETSAADSAANEKGASEMSAIATPLESAAVEEKATSEVPNTQPLSEQVSADMQSFKSQLHQLTLQFHELGTLSSRLMQQLRHLQSDSTDDFSVTYEQMLELRSHLVATKKQASNLPSLLDVAEEALESEMYVAQTRKNR